MQITQLHEIVEKYFEQIKSRMGYVSGTSVFNYVDYDLDYLAIARIINVSYGHPLFTLLTDKLKVAPFHASVLCAYSSEAAKFESFYDALHFIYTSHELEGIHRVFSASIFKQSLYITECNEIISGVIRHNEVMGMCVNDTTSEIEKLHQLAMQELIKVVLYEYWTACRKAECLNINTTVPPYELNDPRFVVFKARKLSNRIKPKQEKCVLKYNPQHKIDAKQFFNNDLRIRRELFIVKYLSMLKTGKYSKAEAHWFASKEVGLRWNANSVARYVKRFNG